MAIQSHHHSQKLMCSGRREAGAHWARQGEDVGAFVGGWALLANLATTAALVALTLPLAHSELFLRRPVSSRGSLS